MGYNWNFIISSVCLQFIIRHSAGDIEFNPCTVTRSSILCSGISEKFPLLDDIEECNVLYLEKSNLTLLTPNDFSQFENVGTLHISDSVVPIDSTTDLFEKLVNLKDLVVERSNVSNNFTHLFRKNIGLNKLSLPENNITRIQNDAFRYLQHIELIDVSLNEITEIEPDAFKSLPALKELNLDHNKIGEKFHSAMVSLHWSVCAQAWPVSKEFLLLPSEEEVWQRWYDNREVDDLWRLLDGTDVNLSLEDNPVCRKVEESPVQLQGRDCSVIRKRGSSVECRLYKPRGCPEHAKRHQFLVKACGLDSETQREGDSERTEEQETEGEGKGEGKGEESPEAEDRVPDAGHVGPTKLSTLLVFASVILFIYILVCFIDWHRAKKIRRLRALFNKRQTVV